MARPSKRHAMPGGITAARLENHPLPHCAARSRYLRRSLAAAFQHAAQRQLGGFYYGNRTDGYRPNSDTASDGFLGLALTVDHPA